jgi:hypothetical protein
MLTVEENETLTRVGPGTPMGKLMRFYWYPVAFSADLPVGHTRVFDYSARLCYVPRSIRAVANGRRKVSASQRFYAVRHR